MITTIFDTTIQSKHLTSHLVSCEVNIYADDHPILPVSCGYDWVFVQKMHRH